MNDKNNETIHCMATVDVIIIGSWLSKAQRLKKMFPQGPVDNNQCSPAKAGQFSMNGSLMMLLAFTWVLKIER